MGGDDDVQSSSISADQMRQIGACSVEQLGQIRLTVAWGNTQADDPAGTAKILEKGLELAMLAGAEDTVAGLQKQCIRWSDAKEASDEALLKDIRRMACEMLGRAGIDPNKSADRARGL